MDDLLIKGAFGSQAIGAGLSTAAELADLAAAWRRWGARPDGFFAFLHGEVIGFAP